MLDLVKGKKACRLITNSGDADRLTAGDGKFDYKKRSRECQGNGIAVSMPILTHHADDFITMLDCGALGGHFRSPEPGNKDIYVLTFRVRNTSANADIDLDLTDFYLVMRDPGTKRPEAKTIALGGYLDKATRRRLCQADPQPLVASDEGIVGMMFLATKHVPWLLVNDERGLYIDISGAYVKEDLEFCGRDHGAGPRVRKRNPVADTETEAQEATAPPVRPGVYAGDIHLVDKEAGRGCVAEESRDLTLTIGENGSTWWQGATSLGMTCQGRYSPPTTCRHGGPAFFAVRGKKTVLIGRTAESKGIAESPFYHLWQCGSKRLAIPAGYEMGNSCVALGTTRLDPTEAVATDLACAASRPWTDLEAGAPITLQGDTLTLPIGWAGAKRKLLLKRIGGPKASP